MHRRCIPCLARLERGELGIFPFLHCRHQIRLRLEFPILWEFHRTYLVVLFPRKVGHSEQRGTWESYQYRPCWL